MDQDWIVRLAEHNQPLLERLFISRNIADPELFCSPDYARDTHDPFLFDDMELAVKRIIQAWRKNERVVVYGDYDVDGLCSAAILFDFFSLMGMNVGIAINHREKEGYGLYLPTIKRLADEGVNVIVTTDSGISNFEEVSVAKARGMDVIVTDHHTVPKNPDLIPPAYAIIHPLVRADRYPFKELSGGGVAFKFLQALIRYIDDEDFARAKEQACDTQGDIVNWEAYEKWLLDLVCMSTIGDCMPLIGENRVFVKFGLLVLGKSRRPGLRAIYRRVIKRTKTLTPETISFYIAPRLNAASRMEHAMIAFDLLMCRTEEEAEKLADVLEEKNTERQRLTERVLAEAKEALGGKLAENKKVLIGMSTTWPLGILGLVAGKLCSQYNRPVVLMTEGHGGLISGAGRSVDSFHITQAFTEIQHVFSRFGGHGAAGGFALKSTEHVNEFFSSFEQIAERQLSQNRVDKPPLMIDTIARLEEVTLEVCQGLSLMQPFGRGNTKPLIQFSHLEICEIRALGETKRHAKLSVRQGQTTRFVIAFSRPDILKAFSIGDTVDVVCELEENEWNGHCEPQMKLTAIRPAHV